MKISRTILALALIQSSKAFVVKGPSTAKSSALAAMEEFRSRSVGAETTSTATTTSTTTTPNAPGVGGSPVLKKNAAPSSKKKENEAVTIQGGCLRTWSFTNQHIIERVQVVLTTPEGRPLKADIDLWQGPDNTPQKMAIYIEDGSSTPFNVCIETPRGQNTVAVRNTAPMEYPLAAQISAGGSGAESGVEEMMTSWSSSAKVIQGGGTKSYTLGSRVGSVQILLKTDGRPLNARIELLQGPDNNKQVVDLYTEDGSERPFYTVIETPGRGNVIRIVNAATMEYPLICAVEPFSVEPGFDESSTKGGGWDQTDDSSFFFLGGQK
jgi:hypothetical protein